MVTRANLDIYQGDDFAAVVNVTNEDGTPADLTNYTAQAQIRHRVADEDPNIVVEITTSIQSPNIFLSLTHQQTVLLNDTYVWDLQLKDSAGFITTILAGDAPVTLEVTRE